MNHLTIVPATRRHAEILAPRLRPEDAAEVAAASGLDPLDALTIGIEGSVGARTILAPDGEPIAVFGAMPLGDGDAAPWLLGSPRILEFWREFARRSRGVLDTVAWRWAHLYNYVDARNDLHMRWLRWLGARFTTLELNYGAERRPFWRFEIV